MFENPKRGRQARNFTTNVPKILDLKSSSENRYFWKIDIGCPWSPALYAWKMFCHFWTDLVSVWMARGIRSKKIFIHLNGLGYLFGKNCRPFQQLVLSVPKRMSSVWTAWAVCLEKIVMAWRTLLVYTSVTPCLMHDSCSRKGTVFVPKHGKKKHAKAQIRHTLGTVKARFKYC